MATPKLELRFSPDRIAYWESRYISGQGDDAEIKEAADRSRSADISRSPTSSHYATGKAHGSFPGVRRTLRSSSVP